MMSPVPDPSPVGGRWPATLTVLMGTISVVLTATIVNVAVPGIMADFDMDQLHAQWLSTGFLAAMTATMLASARAVERLGQQRTFRIALWLFVAASLLAAASWNTPVMIAARILQGAVAGIIQPLALVVIFQVFPDNERGRALGLYGMGVVLAPAVGPAVGGWLMDVFSWRAVYLAALPFCAVGLWGARRTLGHHRAETVLPFDWCGIGLLAAGLALLLGGLAELGLAQAWIPPGWLIAGGLVLLAGFLILQRRRVSPLVNLGVFRQPAFALAFVLALVYGAGLFGSTYLLPLLVQGVQGLSATMTGLVLMPAGLALAMVFPVSGRLSDHWPAHRLIIAGLVLVALAFFALATTGPATGFVVLAAFILLGRIGLGLILPALNLDALRGLPDGLMHQGSGVINFARQLGGAFGVNLFALLLDWRVRQHLHAGGESSLALHNLYQPGAADPAGLQALTRGFAETFMVLGSCFVLAVIPAVAMGVRHARVRANSSGL
ncbi:MAG: DHA2 family efflux MFS transporter permease subunit [Salinisphaeraceae bacterium]